MSNQGYGRNPADYGPVPGQEAGYGQGAYPGQGGAYAGQEGGYGQAGYATQAAGYSAQGAEYGDQGATTTRNAASHASAKGFLGSLFDFGFNSFVGPKIIKIVYVLIAVLLGLGAVGLLFIAFAESAIFGIVALVVICPLYFLINLALWRILLEVVMAIFRMAEDLRSIRERGDLR
jgi:Domain of unknown function (DUF4282)